MPQNDRSGQEPERPAFIPPIYDGMIKILFGSEKNAGLVTAFLGAILDLPLAEYAGIVIDNTAQERRSEEERIIIYDILWRTVSGRKIHIEVQIDPRKIPVERIVYYQARLVDIQMKKGNQWETVRPVITVLILGRGKILRDEADYLNFYAFSNEKSGGKLADLQKLCIIELSKLPETDDGRAVWPWLRFLASKSVEEMNMIAEKHPAVAPAVQTYRQIRSERARYATMLREIAEFDRNYAKVLAEREIAALAKDKANLTKDKADLTEALAAEAEEIRRLKERLRQLGQEV